MTLRVVVVDDETLARNRLRKFLTQEPDLEIIGECASGPEAITYLREHQPDLVFLDVQMPQFNGLDVARSLPAGYLPAIIFVTAHNHYAVEAFKVQALDYLLKPFDRAQLQEAVRRARQRLQAPAGARTEQPSVTARPAENSSRWLNRFAVKDGNQTLFVRTQDVDYIEAAANYVVLCTPNSNYVLRETLRNLESSLSPELFLRVSRSIIINLNRIKAIRSSGPGEWLVVLQNNRELLMTRGLKDVMKRLQYSPVRPTADHS
jgi:two-component system, LytTR family, response regulator